MPDHFVDWEFEVCGGFFEVAFAAEVVEDDDNLVLPVKSAPVQLVQFTHQLVGHHVTCLTTGFEKGVKMCT